MWRLLIITMVSLFSPVAFSAVPPSPAPYAYAASASVINPSVLAAARAGCSGTRFWRATAEGMELHCDRSSLSVLITWEGEIFSVFYGWTNEYKKTGDVKSLRIEK